MSTETSFLAAADATLAAIGAALDTALAASDADVDWSINEGILEIECEDGSKVIVNRHLPNREIWVAARSGGFHFRADAGAWRDTRGGGDLATALPAILATQAGIRVELPRLPVPE
jgi:CyaY protein